MGTFFTILGISSIPTVAYHLLRKNAILTQSEPAGIARAKRGAIGSLNRAIRQAAGNVAGQPQDVKMYKEEETRTDVKLYKD